MNAICLVIDRWNAGHLGAYGNTWIDTPSLDRLACQSFVFDRALIDSPSLERLYRSYWHGWHAMAPELPSEHPSLAGLLRDKGIRTVLVTDDRTVATQPVVGDFDEVIDIDPPWEFAVAEQLEQTRLAQCFVQVIEWLESVRQPFFLWCHLASLGTLWDAPMEFRRKYWEDGDPELSARGEVPNLMLAEDADPDQALAYTQAYAGQVSLLDTCCGALLEFLDGASAGLETLLVLTGSRGFPLGEHRRVGACDAALYSELVHVPLLLRTPDLEGAAARSRMLVEPADLWATLLNYYGIDSVASTPTAVNLLPLLRTPETFLRDRVCVAGLGGEKAIGTPAWYLANPSQSGLQQPALFAKPDDRWEVNNVADRCPEVVECLQDALLQFEQALRSGSTRDLPPLSDVLLHGLE